jgi:hypothetical protein
MIDRQEICCGNPDESFFPLAEARKGKFMDSSGKQIILYKI